jgi:transcription antitermination factor NusG
MASETPPPRGGFRFGDRVRISNGAFAGMTGTLLSPKDAQDRGFPLPRGMLFVVLIIFGHEVPIALDLWELDAT